jgi:hypothetical protein
MVAATAGTLAYRSVAGGHDSIAATCELDSPDFLYTTNAYDEYFARGLGVTMKALFKFGRIQKVYCKVAVGPDDNGIARVSVNDLSDNCLAFPDQRSPYDSGQESYRHLDAVCVVDKPSA